MPTKDLVKGQWSLAPAHVEALQAEARKRAPPGARRTDASEVLREVLDAWLKRRK